MTVVWIAAAAALLFVLDRLLLAAERRGWIYWRRRGPRPGANPMMDLDVMTNPGARLVIEEKEREPAETRTADDIVPPARPPCRDRW